MIHTNQFPSWFSASSGENHAINQSLAINEIHHVIWAASLSAYQYISCRATYAISDFPTASHMAVWKSCQINNSLFSLWTSPYVIVVWGTGQRIFSIVMMTRLRADILQAICKTIWSLRPPKWWVVNSPVKYKFFTFLSGKIVSYKSSSP